MTKFSGKRNIKLLFLILVIGLLLRIYKVSELPLYGDELTMVYDSYSILKTGMDQTGQFFPLTFRMGAGRPAGYVYASIPFVAIFGPTALGVRGLSIVSGLGVLILMYLLGKKLFGERIGLLSAFIASVSPWDLALSRTGFEAHFALFLALLGTTLFLYSKEKPWTMVLGGLFWGLTLHAYPTYKIVLPLFILVIIWFLKAKDWISGKRNKFGATATILILLLFSSLAVRETLYSNSEERFLSVNVFAQEDLRQQLIQKINTERGLAQIPSSLSRVFHNKVFEYSRVLISSYLENFSPDFLFVKGDENPRHNMVEMGELYLIEIFLTFLGIGYLWKKNIKLLTFLILWMAFAPVATTFLLDPHALRNAFMLPPLILLTSSGLSALRELLPNNWKVATILVAIGFLIQFFYLTERLYFLAPSKFDQFWSGPAKRASFKAVESKKSYHLVVLSTKIDNIEFAYPVYAKIDPELVISQYTKFPKRYDNVIITDKIDSFGQDSDTLIIKDIR